MYRLFFNFRNTVFLISSSEMPALLKLRLNRATAAFINFLSLIPSFYHFLPPYLWLYDLFQCSPPSFPFFFFLFQLCYLFLKFLHFFSSTLVHEFFTRLSSDRLYIISTRYEFLHTFLPTSPLLLFLLLFCLLQIAPVILLSLWFALAMLLVSHAFK